MGGSGGVDGGVGSGGGLLVSANWLPVDGSLPVGGLMLMLLLLPLPAGGSITCSTASSIATN